MTSTMCYHEMRDGAGGQDGAIVPVETQLGSDSDHSIRRHRSP